MAMEFMQHVMEEYRLKVFRAHLENEPQRYVTPAPVNDVAEVAMLKPLLESFDIYIYPNEHTIVLEGNNLWFCHEVHLGEAKNILHIKNSAQMVTGRSIQFNYDPTEKSHGLLANDKVVKVTLHSHFANPIRKKIAVKREPYSFSLRQIQLAQHTPSEVIMLAFLSAMLEQYSNKPSDNAPSERLKAITLFLEEAVKVVPIESIFYAIAYDKLETAVKCAKAFLHAKPNIPGSNEILVGVRRAIVRMRTGLDGTAYDEIVYQHLKNLPPFGGYMLSAISQNKLHFLARTCIPVIIPHTPSYSSIVTGSPQDQIGLDIFVGSNEITLSPKRNIDTYPKIADDLDKFAHKNISSFNVIDALCGFSIEHVYPVQSYARRHSMHVSSLKSPLDVLTDARGKIGSLLEDSNEDFDSNIQGTQKTNNEEMLSLVKEIISDNLEICASLLGGFMENQIRIPLLKSEVDTAHVLSETVSPVAMGAWALFSLNFRDLQNMVARRQGNPLFLEIANYISSISSDDDVKKTSNRDLKYAGKLQFLLQGMKEKTITCSSKYISYSLEHQLCSNLKFDKKISVKNLIKDWDKIFKGDALSLVAKSHRSLVARWLKWAVLVHDLRESLAKYTCVGVTGLINSGKSYLVSNLFGIQIKVGTTNRKRTTVPILYNLDGKVNGLDVIDFPGVDDKEHNIPELASLLLSLSQVIIFVVDYRRVSSDSAKEWLEHLKKGEVPVIVCLTHADRLYAEFIEESSDKDPCPTDDKERKIGLELNSKEEDIGHHPSLNTNFYCLHLPVDTTLYNREDLAKVGIGSPWDVGDRLVDVFEKKIKQQPLADELKAFLCNRRQSVHL